MNPKEIEELYYELEARTRYKKNGDTDYYYEKRRFLMEEAERQYRANLPPVRVGPLEQARKEAERQLRYESDAINRAKQDRLNRAVNKLCMECDTHKLHDADDYICIECRDGEAAIPDGEWVERNPF